MKLTCWVKEAVNFSEAHTEPCSFLRFLCATFVGVPEPIIIFFLSYIALWLRMLKNTFRHCKGLAESNSFFAEPLSISAEHLGYLEQIWKATTLSSSRDVICGGCQWWAYTDFTHSFHTHLLASICVLATVLGTGITAVDERDISLPSWCSLSDGLVYSLAVNYRRQTLLVVDGCYRNNAIRMLVLKVNIPCLPWIFN